LAPVILATFACCDCQVNGPEEAEAMVSRVMAALVSLLALLAPSVAQDKTPEGRIAATFYQAQGATQRSKAAALSDSAFQADPGAPIHIEADRLVEVFDGAKQAVFTGIVKLRQGDFQLRTISLTAFYSGQSGFSIDGKWRAEQPIRVEARERVLVKSKDGQTTATADWATLDVMANTMLMGDNVSVSRGKNVAQGPRVQNRSDHGHVPLHRDREHASIAAAFWRASTARMNTRNYPSQRRTYRYPRLMSRSLLEGHRVARFVRQREALLMRTTSFSTHGGLSVLHPGVAILGDHAQPIFFARRDLLRGAPCYCA
jgi:lipopolysaccharide export system protein LptA